MGSSIPKTCYKHEERTPNNLFTESCLEMIEESALKNGHIGLAIKWILFFLEVSIRITKDKNNKNSLMNIFLKYLY